MAEKLTDKTFQFELVSPERILASEEASMVIVPAGEGDIGVLADHAPLLSSLRPGVVTVTSPSGEVTRIFVSGGFVDVTGDLCAVLAEEAVNVSSLDRDTLNQKLKDLEDDLGFAKDDLVKASSVQKNIDIVQAKLAALAA
ncbi:MAG: F0F1 ATP synthase subunit epsilon [Bdellovibrionales bacterium]|jgi:F-type H+-transporting ATPase subunit epsilon|nr:F0F1 ATP synthase subunit epsilon [Bdellovibrionales bacterium]